jgi:hypothetical protein
LQLLDHRSALILVKMKGAGNSVKVDLVSILEVEEYSVLSRSVRRLIGVGLSLAVRIRHRMGELEVRLKDLRVHICELCTA